MRLAASPEHPPSTQTCPGGGVCAPLPALRAHGPADSDSPLPLGLARGCAEIYLWSGCIGRGHPVLPASPQLGRSRAVSPKGFAPSPAVVSAEGLSAGHQQRRSRFHSKARGARRALGAPAAPGASRCSGTSSAPEGATGHGLGGGSAWRGSGTLPRALDALSVRQRRFSSLKTAQISARLRPSEGGSPGCAASAENPRSSAPKWL